MCFMKEGKSDQAARCIKSKIMTKVIDSVLSIDTFEQQCVVLKGMLKLTRLTDHVQTIGIHLYLRNNAIYEHKCIENIKILHKQAGKCDNQQQFKDILEAAMVSTPKVFTYNIYISLMKPAPVKKPSAQKSLRMCTNILYVNKRIAYRRFLAYQYKHKAIKYGNTP